MKNIIILLNVITFVFSGCSQAPKKDDFGNKQNPLYGKNTKEIPELKPWNNYGSIIEAGGKDENGNYRFGISLFKDKNENIICVFTEFLEHDEEGIPKKKILDAINVGKLEDKENLNYCNCRQNTIFDSEIIAIVIEEDKEIFDKIIKAWRANTKTGRIEPIESIKEIDCENYGYGV